MSDRHTKAQISQNLFIFFRYTAIPDPFIHSSRFHPGLSLKAYYRQFQYCFFPCQVGQYSVRLEWGLASIQGSFSHTLFDRKTNIYLGSFTIGEKDNIDGVEETDGLDIFSGLFGSQFPDGIAVVQDGFNYDDRVMAARILNLFP